MKNRVYNIYIGEQRGYSELNNPHQLSRISRTLLSLLLILIALFIGVGCNRTSQSEKKLMQEAFTTATSAGVYSQGVLIKGYSVETDQITTTTPLSTYSIIDLANSQSVTLAIDGEVKVGATLNVTYSAVGVSGLDDGQYSVEVIQCSSDLKSYWLWNSDKSIGFILDIF